MPAQVEYDGSAFRFFAAFILMLYLVPGAYYAYVARREHLKATSPDALKGRSRSESAMLKRRAAKLKLFTPCFVLNLVFMVVAVVCLAILLPSVLSESALEQYDPYAILGIGESSTERQIKRAYRQLSLKYHPDKFKGNDEMFVRITKAYEALTDETARENFRKYGNPDGKQAMSVGIGLPAFLTDKEYQPIVLTSYIVLLVVGVPGIFYLLYLSCRGVEAPRLKRQQESAGFLSVHFRQLSEPPFRVGKFRITEAVAGMADLQPATQKALKGDRIVVEPKHVNELNEVIARRAAGDSVLDAMGGLGGLMVAASASAAAPGGDPSLWPTDTGKPEPVVPRSRLWNNVDPLEPTPPPADVPGVHIVPKLRLTGRNPSKEEPRGMPPSMFVPPLVMDRNHSLLWAHMLRIPASEPAHARLLATAGGADSLQDMLLLAEQQLILAAQIAAQGPWKATSQYLGRDAPAREQALAIRSSLRHLEAAGKPASAKTVARKPKPGAAAAAATGYEADDLSDRDRLDWADAVIDLHDALAAVNPPAQAQQRAADCLRCLLMSQRLAQALAPTASPLAQISALAEAGVALDALGKAAVDLAAPATDDDGDDGDDAAAAGADAARAPGSKAPGAKAGKSSKPGAAKAKAKRQAKAKASAKASAKAAAARAKSKTSDPDDASPSDEAEDDSAARMRPGWPAWLRAAPRGWFRDGGELQAFVSLTPEQRAGLLARNAVPPQVGAEVEAMVASLPRVTLEASATVKRFGQGAREPGQAPTEEFDPFSPAEDGSPRRVRELDLVHVDVVLRHENLGCAAPDGALPAAGGAEAGAAGNDAEPAEDEDDGFDDDGEGEGDEDDGDDVLLEEDGITVRKAKRKPRRKAAHAAKLRQDEPNATVPTPEPHTPFVDRPLPKAERWALFVCTERGWILSLDPIWRETGRPAMPVDVADALTAGVEVSLTPRFLPGPGLQRLFVVAVCLDYAGLDVVQELGTVRLDVNRDVPKSKKRTLSLRERQERTMHEEAVARARSLAEETSEGDKDADAEEEPEEEPHMFEELQTLMRPANQLEEEDEEDIE